MAATTTFRAFVDGLEALSITGVKKAYTAGVPTSISGLPASFVSMPRGESSTISKGRDAHFPTLRANLVVAIQPVPQKTQAINFDAAVDMLDNVKSALDGFSVGKTAPRWKMDVVIYIIGKIEYWAVDAEVEVEG